MMIHASSQSTTTINEASSPDRSSLGLEDSKDVVQSVGDDVGSRGRGGSDVGEDTAGYPWAWQR